jgi:hypothetical protein
MRPTDSSDSASVLQSSVEQGSKEGLRHRHLPLISALTSANDASSSVPAVDPATNSRGFASPQLRLASVTLSAFTGFRPSQREQHYKQWVAVQWRGVALTNSLIVLLWVLASMGRHVNDGIGAFVAQLPLHFLVGTPFLITTLLAANHQYR